MRSVPPPYEKGLSAPRVELGPEDPISGNCRRQKKPTFSPAKDADTITHATDITFEYADTSEFDDCLLGYVMRSSSPEAHAIAAKVEPSSVHATTPIHEEAHSTAFERQSSHRRSMCVSATARDATSPATLAAPFVFSNTCLPASACVPSTSDAHGLFLARPHNVAISTTYVPESPVNVATSHLSSAIATNSIRRISAQQVPHILCSQNIVAWLVELWLGRMLTTHALLSFS